MVGNLVLDGNQHEQQNAVLRQAASLLLTHVRIVSNKQLAEALDVSKRTLYSWRKQGIIAFTKVRGKIYYSLADVTEMLRAGYMPSTEISIEEKNTKIENGLRNTNNSNNA